MEFPTITLINSLSPYGECCMFGNIIEKIGLLGLS